MYKRITPFIISTGLHLSVLVLFSLVASGNLGNDSDDSGNKKGGSNNSKREQIIPKTVEVDLVEIEKEGDIPTKSPVGKAKKCVADSWFGGIGVTTKAQTITEVFDGYPAQLSGLKVGDVIVNVSSNTIRGDPGTKVKIVVYRPSIERELTFLITRDKICYFEEK